MSFYESVPILETNYWNKYKHYFVNSMDGNSFTAINQFYSYALEIQEQQMFAKELQKKSLLLVQQAINNLEFEFIKNGINSNYGKIVSSWTASDGVMSDYNVVVPANTTATLYLPVLNENTAVYENGTPIADVDGIEFVKYENGMNVYNLGSGSYHFTTDVSNNITEINTDVKVSVYPNPVKDRLYLSCNEEISKVNLCSMSGNIVKTINGSCSSIDVSDMSAGVYLLNIWCKDGVHTTKVIKQ